MRPSRACRLLSLVHDRRMHDPLGHCGCTTNKETNWELISLGSFAQNTVFTIVRLWHAVAAPLLLPKAMPEPLAGTGKVDHGIRGGDATFDAVLCVPWQPLLAAAALFEHCYHSLLHFGSSR